MDIIGRFDGNSLDARAEVEAGPSMSIEYLSGACGVATVQIFKSKDDEDRGGIVLKFSIKDQASSFIPHAVVTQDGVELHMAGDAEADAILRALKAVLAAYDPKG